MRTLTWPLLKRTWKEWNRLNPNLLGAGLAFFALFSLLPVFLLTAAWTGQIASNPRMQEKLLEKVSIWLPSDAEVVIERWLERAPQHREARKRALGIGFLALVLASAQGLIQIQRVLNIVWGVPSRTRGFHVHWLRSGLYSLTIILGLGLLVLLSFGLELGAAAFWRWGSLLLPQAWQTSVGWIAVLNGVFSVLALAGLVGLLYRFGPDTRVRWANVWPAALLTAGLLAAAKFAVSFYLGFASYQTAYGAAGSLLVLMFSLHIAAQIFLFGAVLSRELTNRVPVRLRPTA